MNKVYFIGAGPGDPELITIKGARILRRCGLVITAGSLVAPELLQHAESTAEIYDSAVMNLEEIIALMKKGIHEGKDVARLHTGDPSIYGAVQEQMAELDRLGITYVNIPGVTSLFAAAAALQCELTVPEVSQTVIITRYAGRTPVPENFANVAKAGGTLCLYLSANLLDGAVSDLIDAGRKPDTPAAAVYKASQTGEIVIRGKLSDISSLMKREGIDRQAIVIIGEAVSKVVPHASKLYDKHFTHGYRDGDSDVG